MHRFDENELRIDDGTTKRQLSLGPAAAGSAECRLGIAESLPARPQSNVVAEARK
jgi:hypothetical protein